jgi:hypothetical protein
MRHSIVPTLAVLVLAASVLGGCGSRSTAPPPAPVTTPAATTGALDPDPRVLGIPADTTLVSGVIALPAMARFDQANGFWAATIAATPKGPQQGGSATAVAAAPPADAGDATAASTADQAQAAAMLDRYAQQDAAAKAADAQAPTVAAADAPAPAAGAQAPAQPAAPDKAVAVITRPVQVGTLSLPATVVPGNLHAARANMIPPAIAAHWDLYLLRVPLAWVPAKGFDRPLQRIAGNLIFDGNSIHAGWRLLGISARGFEGLRRGPDPTYPNATGWWFKPAALAARLAGESPSIYAVWHEDAASRPLTGTLPLFALILAPHDAREADATITAAVSVSPGAEATITLPPAHVRIDLQRPAAVANAGH